MDERTITACNEATRTSAEHLLDQLRSEGLAYDLWVTGTAQGSTVHMRVRDLDAGLRARLGHVLGHMGAALDLRGDGGSGRP